MFSAVFCAERLATTLTDRCTWFRATVYTTKWRLIVSRNDAMVHSCFTFVVAHVQHYFVSMFSENMLDDLALSSPFDIA
jgi:hypothetical protein